MEGGPRVTFKSCPNQLILRSKLVMGYVHILYLSLKVPCLAENFCYTPIQVLIYSLASLHGTIEHFDTYLNNGQLYMIQILEASTTPVTFDMGQVSGGHIRLRCWLKLFSIEKEGDISDDDNHLQNTYIITAGGKCVCSVSFDEWNLVDLERQKFFCLPILRDSLEDTPVSTEVAGLLLKPLGKVNYYEKVGFFETNDEKTSRYFARLDYPATSTTPTDGKASLADVISELIQGINFKASQAVENTPETRALAFKTDVDGSGKNLEEVSGNGSDDLGDYEYDEGWVESIITIV